VTGPIHGVRVVELGIWVAAPAAGSILADWGADVIKVEAPTGDPMRAASAAVLPPNAPFNPHFQTPNRGKRSIALDLRSQQGREHLLTLLDAADVFVTNVRAAGLARLGLDPETVCARNPALIYAIISAYGLTGPDADTGGYDLGAFWARSGIAHLLTVPGGAPPIQRSAMGDNPAGLTAAAMISAALFHRERTGKGQLVSTSLMRVAAFHVASDFNAKLMIDEDPVYPDRRSAVNPIWNNYAASDGRRFWLICPAPDRHWPVLARIVGRLEWLDDPRYATQAARKENCRELIAELDEIFASAPYDHWTSLFDSEPDFFWAPVNSIDEVLADPQTRAAGVIVEVAERDGRTEQIASPVDFHGTPCGPVAPAPLLGEHTADILSELDRHPGSWPAALAPAPTS
jgi:crotonobetainyl-CoA:carnitine CoA-transferase CaiB-like acyl-CoA transferase